LTLSRFDEIQADIPVVAKFKPSSQYNLFDYHKAGGVRATLKAIEKHLYRDVEMVMGGTMGDLLDGFNKQVNPDVIKTEEDPLHENGSFSVLYGNLAPKGAVIKKSGVDPSMYFHEGPAVVFDSEEDLRD